MATVCDWLKILRNFLSHSEVKSKPFPTYLAFSRAWRGCMWLLWNLFGSCDRLSILWLARGVRRGYTTRFARIFRDICRPIPRPKRSQSSFFLRYLPLAARHFMHGKGAGPPLNCWLPPWSLLLNIFQGSHSLKMSFNSLIPVCQNMSVRLPQKVAQIWSRAIPQVKWPAAAAAAAECRW